MSSIKQIIKKIIKANRLKSIKDYIVSKDQNHFAWVNKNKKKIVVGLAADYSNLGDVAITYAQTKFLRDNFPDREIIDFPISETYIHMKELKKICNPDDIITLVGGGNMGDAYDSAEFARQFIIRQFPNNRIISFPQTIEFSKTKNGDKEFKKAKKIYSKHKNLTIMAREQYSYGLMKKEFPTNNIYLYPDIVLYLNESEPYQERSKVTLTLRNDKEVNINKYDKKRLISYIENNFSNTITYDTDIKKEPLNIKEREIELKKIWGIYRDSKIVITDRLHGMIFCAITNTPCIAINNSNKKVERVHKKWLSKYSFIYLVSDFNLKTIINLLNDIKETKNGLYSDFKLKNELQEIRTLID